mmetsp:Transcript_45622/g.123000  ORF Transcript_45622/g.123000 Transcript_45622/m.123000 type:complete len:230 (-) Transcript_45622:383-1072(-)
MDAYCAPEAFLISISGSRPPWVFQTSCVDRKANSSSPPSISRWMPTPDTSAESPSARRAWKSAVSPGTARLLMLTTRFCLRLHTMLGSAHCSVQFFGTTSCGQSVVSVRAPLSSDASDSLLTLVERRPLLARLPAEPGTEEPGMPGLGIQEWYDASLVILSLDEPASAFLAPPCSPAETERSSRRQPRVQHSAECPRATTRTNAAPPTHSPSVQRWCLPTPLSSVLCAR